MRGCIIDFFGLSCYLVAVVVFLCYFSIYIIVIYIPLTLAYLLLNMSPCMLGQG